MSPVRGESMCSPTLGTQVSRSMRDGYTVETELGEGTKHINHLFI